MNLKSDLVSDFGMVLFFFFKQKPAYEVRISDWSSDVCSSDLRRGILAPLRGLVAGRGAARRAVPPAVLAAAATRGRCARARLSRRPRTRRARHGPGAEGRHAACRDRHAVARRPRRSEEHTSELQSLMRISYAVFCLKKKTISR